MWAIRRSRRRRPLNAAQPQRVALTAADAEILRHGTGYFGGLDAFHFQCPGPCSTVHEIRPRQRQRHFDPRTQRFRCPHCRIELQLSILAEILPPPMTKRGAAAFEDDLLENMADRQEDTLPTVELAATVRRDEEGTSRRRPRHGGAPGR